MTAASGAAGICAELTVLSASLIESLADAQAERVSRHGASMAEIQSLNFRPRPHHGVCVGELGRSPRRLILRLLSCVTAPNVFALVTTIMGLEDVIGQRSEWSKDQTSGDYWFAFYPRADGCSMFRFEGHHVSITAAWSDSELIVSPICLGAYPAHMVSRGHTLLRPLAVQSQLAREIIELYPALVADVTTPREIIAEGLRSYPEADFGGSVLNMRQDCRDRIVELVHSYLDLAVAEANYWMRRSVAINDLRFAWMGSLVPDEDHYFVVHDGRDLCIEYINQCHQESTANHEHTVIRSRHFDFGNGLMAP